MKQHFIVSQGLECFESYPTLEEARKDLKIFVEESLSDCRKRFGQAKKEKMGKDSYRISFGCGYNTYATHSIRTL